METLYHKEQSLMAECFSHDPNLETHVHADTIRAILRVQRLPVKKTVWTCLEALSHAP